MNQFTLEESIRVIQQMMDQKKVDMRSESGNYLLWGAAGLLCSILHYLLLEVDLIHPALAAIPWAIIMPLTAIASYFLNKNKARKVLSSVDTMIWGHWQGFIFAMTIVLFGAFRTGWHDAYFVLLVLYGWGLHGAGRLIRFTPLILGGYACWCLALLSLWVNFQTNVLFIGLAMIFGYILPGMALRSQKDSKTDEATVSRSNFA
jgi:hypothetical protein